MVNTSKYTQQQLEELMFTEKEKKELAAAREMPISYDEDCPPVTPERARNFKRAKERKLAQ